MYKKTGMAALVAAASITAMAGCSSTAANTAGAGGGTSTANTGSGTGSMAPASVLLTALTKASGDNTVTITGSVTGGTANTTTHLSGVEQFQPLKSSLTIDTSGGTTGAMNLAAIYDGTNFYLKSPQLSALEGGKPWLELNLASLGSGSDSLSSMMNSIKTESPTAQMGALLGAGDLKSVGTQTINGVQTTHYHGTLTGDQAANLAAVNGLSTAQVQQIKSLFSAGGIQSETLDVWVGSDNLPVQVVVVTTSSSLGTSTATTDFTNWGAPVTITDPPASQVGTFSIPTS